MRQSLDVKRMKMKTRLTSEMPDADDTHVHVSTIVLLPVLAVVPYGTSYYAVV